MSTFQYKGAYECKKSSINVRVARSEHYHHEMNPMGDLIPYFIVALVSFNDTATWTYGPEYSYDMNITYIIKPDPHEHVHKVQLISTLKCRPKTRTDMFCHLYNFTESEIFEDHNVMTRKAQAEQMFEIKFNRHGVEGLVIEPPSRMEVVNVLRKIASQFNVILDWSKISLQEDYDEYMSRENSSMGNCATTYKITRSNLDPRNIRERDFSLLVLSWKYVETDVALLIEKSRMGCIDPPRYVDFSRGILEMRRFISRIEIAHDRFDTLTEFDGIVRFSTESEIGILSFKEIIQINLNSIGPAPNELPTLSYSEMIDLNTNNNIPNNFIN